MTLLEWIGIFAALAAWTGLLFGMFQWGHAQRQRAIDARERRIMAALDAHAEQSSNGQKAISLQVQDMARTMQEGYVPRREFDQSMRGVREGLTQLGRDIGGVGNRIDGVSNRIDDIMRHARWRDAE